ncbi:MAG: hypothetical protein Q9209_002152 [Squamulea sp. 1 TL-2023]
MDQLVKQPETGTPPKMTTARTHNGSFDDKGNDHVDVERRNGVGANVQPRRATSDLSLDDLEAAQALEGLRADCAQQPIVYYDSHHADSKIAPSLPSPPPFQQAPEPEPLLALFTAQHPLLSTAINAPLSAYTCSKSFSPRFKYGAELVERHVGSPVVSTVRTAGKFTGLENGVRWFLDGDRRGGPSRAPKRRRTSHQADGVLDDVEQGPHDEVSVSTLDYTGPYPGLYHDRPPPYDDERSPTYERHDSSVHSSHSTNSSSNTTWRTRLVMSTSGLGVAMSEESLRNLKYCLSWLRWGNNYLNKAIRDLQGIITEYNAKDEEASEPAVTRPQGEQQAPDSPQGKTSISGRMHSLKSDILTTMSRLCHVVSQYTGGALPANARSLVHAHLTALPGRFTYVLRLKKQQSASPSTQQDSPNDSRVGSPVPEPAVDSAHRVLILASEGLDMIAQITSIVHGTINSAEEWCEQLGRNRQAETSNNQQQPKRQEEENDKKGMGHTVYSDTTYEKAETKDMTE